MKKQQYLTPTCDAIVFAPQQFLCESIPGNRFGDQQLTIIGDIDGDINDED